MSPSPRVAAIAVFHKRAAGVPRTVESLLAQDYPNLDIVLVDDGSGDATLSALRRYESARVRVVTHPNKGFTAALKDAIAETACDLIAIQGSGDESFPPRISSQVALLQRHPRAVAAGCGIVNVDELTNTEWEVRPEREFRPGPIESGFGISHGELMFRRTAYERVGGYRTFFRLGQASDLLRRLTLLGGVAYAQEILYRRYLAPDGVNAKPEQVALRNLYAALSIQALRRRSPAPLSHDGPLPPDEIDRYGPLAAYFMPCDAAVAKASAAASAKFLALQRREEARQFAEMSLRQSMTWRGLAAWWMACMAPAAAPLAMLRHRRKGPSEQNPMRFLSRNPAPKGMPQDAQ